VNLYGRVLAPPTLRFNSASKYAVHTQARAGIRKFGPFDTGLFTRSVIRCGSITAPTFNVQRHQLIQGLENGEGTHFPGFAALFRTKLGFDAVHQIDADYDDRSFARAANNLAAAGCELVFVLVSGVVPAIYRACKNSLLGNGVPCQFVDVEKIRNPAQRPWILANIALASYAKAGGTPWVVADGDSHSELIIGVSRAQDETGAVVVGFVTVFNQDGDFLMLHSKAPVVEWDAYAEELEAMLVEAYQSYIDAFGAPVSLVVHFHKRPGRTELSAVEHALASLPRGSGPIPFALVHLNEYSLFRLFDTSQASYVPQSGLQVDLGSRRALLLLDGRENGQRTRIGVPNVWDISMDRRSTMSVDEFPRLVGHAAFEW